MTIPIKSNMQVQSGATISATGTGAIDATETGGINVTGNQPSHAGQILISQTGNTSALWADPQVQGLYADGSSISSPPAYSAPTTICPVYVGGNKSGNLTGLSLDTSSNLYVNVQTGAVTVSGTVAVSSVSGTVAVTGTFFQATQPVSGTVAVSSVSGSVAVTGTFFQATQPVSIASSVPVTQSTTPWEVSPTASANTAANPFFNEIVTGSSNVFSHILNQDGSGNVGVNVENTVAVTGTFSGSTVTQVTPGTYVQSAGASFTSSSTAVLTLTSNVVGGDTIFVGFSYTSTSTISSVVDNLGNQYKQITTTGPENSLDYALYYATGCFAGATTITVTFNTTTSGEIVGAEYNGQVYLLTQAGSFGTGTTFTTGAQSPLGGTRSNSLNICFAYAQGGTLVTNNAITTSSGGKALSPRFTNSNYMLGEAVLNEPESLDFSFAQASSSGYAFIIAQLAIMNPAQVPLANATFYQKPGAWIPVGGVDTAGSSVTGGVISVQGVSSGGLYMQTDIYKNALVSLSNTTSGIGSVNGSFTMPVSGQYQLAQPLLTTSNSQGLIQLDIRGNQLTTVGVQTTVGSAWSSGTAINTLQYLPGSTTEGQLVGFPAMYIQLDNDNAFSAGAVTFQGTYDNVNWVTIPVAQVLTQSRSHSFPIHTRS